MKTIAARDAKNNFGALIDDARREPVTIQRNGRPAVVVLSPETYEELVRLQDASWAARAEEVIREGEFLSHEEGVKTLQGFIAGS